MSGAVRVSQGVPYVAKGRTAPATFKAPTTCGTCGRTWDDAVVTSWTPTPSGRCPFEYMNMHRQTKVSRAVTVKVQFERLTAVDEYPDSSYLTQDDFAERYASYKRGDWHFIAIRARAHVDVTRGKVTTSYTLDSPGLYGIESDSDDSYLEEVFREECATLEADIKAFGGAKR